MFILFGCQMDHGSADNMLITGDMENSLVGPRAADYEEQQIVISNPDYIEDAPLDPTHPYHNFGAHDGGRAGHKWGYHCDAFLIRLVDLQDLIPPRSRITSCKMYLYVARGDSLTDEKQVCARGVFKPWVEGDGDWNYQPPPGEGCTFDKWDGRAYWGILGCRLEDDLGEPNTGNAWGADCTERMVGRTWVPHVNGEPWVVQNYYEFDLDPELVQQWLERPENEGLVLRTAQYNSWVHLGTVEAPAGERPYFEISFVPIVTPVGELTSND
jgi:hypothetical protein